MTERRSPDREQVKNAEGFARFWAAYPVKVGRLAVIREWNKLKPDETLVTKMLETLAWQKTSKQWREGFVPHPRTWIYQGRYLDEPPQNHSVGHAGSGCPHTPRCKTTGECGSRREMEAAVQDGRITQEQADRYLAKKRAQAS